MLRDKVLLGALAGIFANFVMEIPELILWKMKILSHPLFHYLGSLFMPVETSHHIYLGEVMGFVGTKVYGAFLGVVFIIFLTYSGYRFVLSKGLLYGAFLWLFSYGGLASIPIVKLSTTYPRMPLENLLFFLLHLLFGFTLGLFIKVCADADNRPRT
ncbi:MAG TPA: hypothetical protein GXZ98_11125 [Firmicutes bacterium]|jgi:hypothetical protein|nr:hypothetical protein [Bacillota bacterium]